MCAHRLTTVSTALWVLLLALFIWVPAEAVRLNVGVGRGLLVGAPKKSLWSPASLGSALVGWWDASQSSTITIATGVSNWASRSPATIALTQATGAHQPTYAANTVTSTGQQGFNVAGWPAVYDVLAVGLPIPGAGLSSMLADSTHGYAQVIVTSVGNAVEAFAGTFGPYDTIDWTVSGMFYMSMPASTIPSGAYNGGTTTFSSAETFPTPQVNKAIGRDDTVQQWGTMQEMVVVNRKLTAAEYQFLIGYEACKPAWAALGLQALIPAGSIYKSAASCSAFAYP